MEIKVKTNAILFILGQFQTNLLYGRYKNRFLKVYTKKLHFKPLKMNR